MTFISRKVAETFTPGTRVVATDGATMPHDRHKKRYGAMEGTVARFIPMNNAQGGTVVVEWDNGNRAHHSAGSLATVEERDSKK